MSTLREAAQQALEALESCSAVPHWPALQPTITALRDALAQEEQEPVAWMVYTEDGKSAYVADNSHDLVGAYKAFALYTHPPRREWQSLTEDENNELSLTMVKGYKSVNWLSRAIERALKEKNA